MQSAGNLDPYRTRVEFWRFAPAEGVGNATSFTQIYQNQNVSCYDSSSSSSNSNSNGSNGEESTGKLAMICLPSLLLLEAGDLVVFINDEGESLDCVYSIEQFGALPPPLKNDLQTVWARLVTSEHTWLTINMKNAWLY